MLLLNTPAPSSPEMIVLGRVKIKAIAARASSKAWVAITVPILLRVGLARKKASEPASVATFAGPPTRYPIP